ncbi:ParB/RepB/Spo0J family partition protein [uncultured Eubacterium sp.]|uniref:ParB/RepB/Spo0J family partition protein n=1 Tax=uncultured Eubacterium sp. TaxID=165185 RepID=UPI002601BF94|nr:ParB/RepB/Spo0J family partition protein [uncultured Eubacterium sp.]
MAGRKSDFTLTRLDDLFSTQEQRDDEKLSKIRDIPLTEIDDFPDHPFKVRDDEDMAQLVESVKERGVITPATVRQKEDGRYELISGHRRKRACELAGLETLRCEVVDLNRDEATILMVESNYQRSQILPSEKAFAYKMRLEAMKRQGERTDLTCDPLGDKLAGTKSVMLLADKSDDSKTQIQRYVPLTNLVPELLDYVDEGRIKMRPAVELSYLDEDRRYNAQKFEEQFYNAKGLKNVEEGKTAPMPKFETSVELLDPMAEVQETPVEEEENSDDNSVEENASLIVKLLSNPEAAALLKALAKTI